MEHRHFPAFYERLLDTQREEALALVQRCLDEGDPPSVVVFEIIIPALERMAQSIVDGGETNLAQHFVTSQTASELIDQLLPMFDSDAMLKGRIVIGTAARDFHGLGKRIVGGCLKASMVDVVDLGLNVSAERFVDAALEHEAQIIGVSSMMVHTARSPEGPTAVRRILRERGLEEQIKLIVGGAPYRFHPELYQAVGADGWAADGLSAATLVVGLLASLQEGQP